ncbi:MAG: hypothetical protein HYW91_00890 [Candidatus Sungbacteria bacterium]|nr:hypothetical protein [Candidatus Sungbacteria bacterium]
MMDNSISPNASPRFQGQVLNKIYRVWLFRKLLPVLIFEVAALTAILYWLGRAIFFQRIFENALRVLFINPQQIFSFALAMFTNATPLARILGFIILALFVLIVRHFTQGFLRLILVRQNYFSRAR